MSDVSRRDLIKITAASTIGGLTLAETATAAEPAKTGCAAVGAEAMLLMVECQWRRQIARTGGSWHKLPVKSGDANDIALIQGCLDAAQAFMVARKGLPERFDPKVEFYRAFWKHFFLHAAPRRSAALGAIDKKALLGDKEDGRGGLVDQFAGESALMLSHSAKKLDEYDRLIAALSLYPADARKRMLESLTDHLRGADEVGKGIRDSVEARLKGYDELTKDAREKHKEESKEDRRVESFYPYRDAHK